MKWTVASGGLLKGEFLVKNDGDGGCFHNYKNKLCSGKPIFRFGAGLFVFIFMVLSSLPALFALFLA